MRSCTPGAFCPDESISNAQYSCIPGKYLDFHNGGADVDCKDCPAGTYCPIRTVVPLKCPVGYYCPVNSIGDVDIFNI